MFKWTLPAISKVFEKVIFKQLYEFFQANKLFYNSQYVFRTKHSTEFAALEVIDRIMVEMDKNDISHMCILWLFITCMTCSVSISI